MTDVTVLHATPGRAKEWDGSADIGRAGRKRSIFEKDTRWTVFGHGLRPVRPAAGVARLGSFPPLTTRRCSKTAI